MTCFARPASEGTIFFGTCSHTSGGPRCSSSSPMAICGSTVHATEAVGRKASDAVPAASRRLLKNASPTSASTSPIV